MLHIETSSINLIFRRHGIQGLCAQTSQMSRHQFQFNVARLTVVLLGYYPDWKHHWLKLTLLWPDHTCRASTSTLHYWFHISTQIIILKKYLSYNGNYNIWDESCELNIMQCMYMYVCVRMYVHTSLCRNSAVPKTLNCQRLASSHITWPGIFHVIVLTVYIPHSANAMATCEYIHSTVSQLQMANPQSLIMDFNHISLSATLHNFSQYIDCHTGTEKPWTYCLQTQSRLTAHQPSPRLGTQTTTWSFSTPLRPSW